MTIELKNDRFEIRFDYDTAILAAVRVLPQRTWHADDKYWSAANTEANRTALVQLTERFGAELDDAATAALPASETQEVLEYIISNSYKLKNEPEYGYTVRGGGQMRDGAQWEKGTASGGRLRWHECPTDTSGLSGSGRSGYVEYEIPATGTHIFRVTEINGSIANQHADSSVLLLYRGLYYAIDEDAACAILGVTLPVDDEEY